MIEITREPLVLKCDSCGEYLHSRIVFADQPANDRIMRLCRHELFCPVCQKVFSLFNHLKQQMYEAKKTIKKIR